MRKKLTVVRSDGMKDVFEEPRDHNGLRADTKDGALIIYACVSTRIGEYSSIMKIYAPGTWKEV